MLTQPFLIKNSHT
uniref:Uncharacterized protein n=1 Tax=Arundo donax TaxID=35708 RepID=A0A0A9BNH1_ARUDO